VAVYFFVGLAGALSLSAAPAVLRNRWTAFSAAVFLTVAVGHFLIYPWWPHYSAPALAALLITVVACHRWLYGARRSVATPERTAKSDTEPDARARAFGPALLATTCAAQLAVFAFQIPAQRADPTDASRQRARLAWEFEQRAGKHLLVVSYPSGWSGDWTFNRADVDAAKVVWATDLGEERNQELLRYYSDRTAWAIDARFDDTDPVPRLIRPAVSDQ
jgi:hypothetical protein